MKKCITYLVVLVIVLLVSDRILSYALDAIIDKSDFRHVNMFHESPDIYAVGNSRGVFSIWEGEFDKTYDLDILNISFTRLNSESIDHLTRAINKDKILLIEISSFLSNKPEETGEISPIFKSIKGLREENLSITDDFSNLFRSYNFNNRSTLRLMYHIFKSDKNWTQKREINESIITKLKQSNRHNLHIKKQFFDYLKFLQNENYNFIFYHAPYHPLHRDKIVNIEELHHQLNDILGNRFIDLTDLLNEDIYFADGVHSNYRATEYIHAEIVTRVKELQ